MMLKRIQLLIDTERARVASSDNVSLSFDSVLAPLTKIFTICLTEIFYKLTVWFPKL